MSATSDVRADVFAAERPRLVGLAYRLLGSLADAEDVVQEAWIRWSRAEVEEIERPAAWLTTVVSRLGLDRLRAARRARIDYVGPWLPDPLLQSRIAGPGPVANGDPASAAELADSLTTAFLVLLERLSPDERLVVLLVDVFGEPFAAAAAATGRSEQSCRQLAVRARRKLREAAPGRRQEASHAQLDVATRFAAAVREGDVDVVVSMLSPDAVMLSDGGAERHAARRPVRGPRRIARLLVNLSRRAAEAGCSFEAVWVNGRPGLLTSFRGEPVFVNAIDVVDGVVERCWGFANPHKLVAGTTAHDLV